MARTAQNQDFAVMIPEPHKYDIIIWGAQECEMKAKEKQMKALDTYLGPDYYRVTHVVKWEMFVMCSIHKKHMMWINSPKANTVELGVMNMIGNKGAQML